MLTLYVSGLIIAVFLLPGIVFRNCFSLFLPLRRFQRTNAEEITFAAKVCALPFAIVAVIVSFTGVFFRFPIRTGIDNTSLAPGIYTVLRAAVDDAFIRSDAGFSANTHASGQVLLFASNLLLTYYLLLALEGCLLGWLARQFGDPRYRERYRWLVEKVLPPGISEWYVLLTTFASRRGAPPSGGCGHPDHG